MAKAFHNLAGLCRDLRAAALAAAEGNQEAADICVAFDDAMELHDAFISGDMDGGEDPDAPASGDDAEDEGDDVPRDEGRRSERMGAQRARATVHSTRDRMRRDASPRGRRDEVSVPACVPTAVPPARTRHGGKR